MISSSFSFHFFLILLALFPSTPSIAQSLPARWEIADKKHVAAASFDQRWGQSLVTVINNQPSTQHSSITLSSSSTSSPAVLLTTFSPPVTPRLLDWREWQKMVEKQVPGGRNGTLEKSPKAFAGPILIVAKGGEGENDEEEEEEGKEGRMKVELPAEAEEEEKEGEWKDGWAHAERTLTAGPLPINMTHLVVKEAAANEPTTAAMIGNGGSEAESTKMQTVDFLKFSNKFTTPTTPMPTILDAAPLQSSTNGNTAAGFGIAGLDLSPFGQNIKMQPQTAAMDLRQLPGLMLLLKQIPTVLRSFQENPSITAGSASEKIGAQNGADFFPLPNGNGLLQQFLGGTTNEASKIQSRAVSEEYGGISPSEGSSPLVPLASPIVPVATSHAGFPLPSAAHIDIRQLPPSPLHAIPKMDETNGLQGGKEEKTKIGQKERQQRLNIYGAAKVTSSSGYEAPSFSTNYLPEKDKSKKKRPRPQFDIEKLTVGELGQLEKIHKKLLTKKNGEEDGIKAVEDIDPRRMNPSFIAPLPSSLSTSEKGPVKSSNRSLLRQLPSPQSTEHTQPAHLKELVMRGMEMGQLDQSMLNDLLAIGELPDLEELTSGMDLSLLHKPGGFAVLKQQFIERLIHRALGNKRLK